MTRLRLDLRVRVHRALDHGKHVFLGGAPGTVVRLRRSDDQAWVELDERSAVPGAHPFPESDRRRGRHVLVEPSGCTG